MIYQSDQKAHLNITLHKQNFSYLCNFKTYNLEMTII